MLCVGHVLHLLTAPLGSALLSTHHPCPNLCPRRKISQHSVILLARPVLRALPFRKTAQDAHGLAVLTVRCLVSAAAAASGEGTLVPEAKLAMLGALAAAVGAHLAVGESLGELVRFGSEIVKGCGRVVSGIGWRSADGIYGTGVGLGGRGLVP